MLIKIKQISRISSSLKKHYNHVIFIVIMQITLDENLQNF